MALEREAKLDGKYLLRSSDRTLSAEDIALGDTQFAEVEHGWRDLEQVLDLRRGLEKLRLGSSSRPTGSFRQRSERDPIPGRHARAARARRATSDAGPRGRLLRFLLRPAHLRAA